MESLTCPQANAANLVIMAGGRGSRLASLVKNTPKTLIKLHGKPLIHHLIDHLVSCGINTLHISVGYQREQIVEFLGTGKAWDITIRYIHEDKPLGSIGALGMYKEWIYDYFLVINGDIFTNFNVQDFVANFFHQKADMAILTLQNEITIPWGVLTINSDGEVIKLEEKPKCQFLISTGIYFFNKKILGLISLGTPMEGWELIQSALKADHKVVGIAMKGDYWIDIGTPETLRLAHEMFQEH